MVTTLYGAIHDEDGNVIACAYVPKSERDKKQRNSKVCEE
jgi:hypothetical protein